MNADPITFPHVGARVWTIGGLHKHGRVVGPKVDVPTDTGGVIAAVEQPYLTMAVLLYVVRWDTGQVSKHYFKELFVIGPFATLDGFSAAVSRGTAAYLIVGPQGGFREFSMTRQKDGVPLQVKFVKEQRDHWEHTLRPMLQVGGIRIETERLETKAGVRTAKPNRGLTTTSRPACKKTRLADA